MARRPQAATLGCALDALLSAAGCARRAAPYHFRAPLVGAVQPIAAPALDGDAPPPRRRRAEPPPAVTPEAIALAAAPPPALVLARPRPRPPSDDPRARLRAQVGGRRADDPVAFALSMLAGPDGFD